MRSRQHRSISAPACSRAEDEGKDRLVATMTLELHRRRSRFEPNRDDFITAPGPGSPAAAVPAAYPPMVFRARAEYRVNHFDRTMPPRLYHRDGTSPFRCLDADECLP